MPEPAPRVHDDLAVADVDGEAVVYNPRTRQLHHLNPSAALVLSLCDGEASPAEMAAEIADVAGLPTDVVAAQVDGVVRDFDRQGFLASPSDEPAKPVDQRPRVRMEVPHST